MNYNYNENRPVGVWAEGHDPRIHARACDRCDSEVVREHETMVPSGFVHCIECEHGHVTGGKPVEAFYEHAPFTYKK